MNEAIRADVARVIAEQQGLAQPGDFLPTREQLLAKRSELMASGKPHGLRPLSAACHTSVSVVRRRLPDLYK